MISSTTDRSNPPLWDHQRHILRRLFLAIRNSLTRLGIGKDTMVVDLGCGDCPYQAFFADCNYIRCDLSGDIDVTIRPGQPLDLPSGCADVVVSFQVLEHVWDLDWYLNECKRLLKPGGRLVLSTHGTWLYHPHPHDFRRWTRDGLIAELALRSFDVESTVGIVGPLAWTTQFRLLGLRNALLRVPILGQLILAPLAVIMNLRMLLEDAITPNNITQTNACVYLTVSTSRSSLGVS
jgi:SAM-dependent methyltransferase